MTKTFKKYLMHFVLFLLEACFTYLHKTYDVYYDLECEKFMAFPKKEGEEDEKSGI